MALKLLPCLPICANQRKTARRFAGVIYASRNPMYFGVDDERQKVCTLPIAAPEIVQHEGKYYIVALNPGLDGIRMARLEWVVR